MVSTSRARATFQSELIEQSIEDRLPNSIKGAAVYRSFDEQEGYYVFDKNLQGYIPIHYLEDKRLWTLIDYDNKVGSWYTTQPAPLEYSLGLQKPTSTWNRHRFIGRRISRHRRS